MKNKIILTSILIFFTVIFSACSSGNNTENEITTQPTQPQTQNNSQEVSPENVHSQPDNIAKGEVVVTFNYEKQSGWASNQFAVWIEDINGNYIKTLYVTDWTANGGYNTRPDSIPVWVEKSAVSSAQNSDIDAVSGATPRASGTHSYTWDLTDVNGDFVKPGEYKFFVEGTLRWKNQVMHSGVIDISGDSVVVEADAVFTFEASDGQAALTENSPETDMIAFVKAEFIPADESNSQQEISMQPEYRRITADTAYNMIQADENCIILDVRTIEEHLELRIPKSILLPYDEIESRAESELPHKDALILVYCRSGRRSEIAARELVEMNYTNVYDFGGIEDWGYATESP